MKKFSIICMLIMILLSCKTKNDKLEEEKMNWDYEKHVLEIQKIINKGNHKEAIEQIEELMIKYPGTDIYQLRYLIGYSYYSLKIYDTAKGYFEGLIHTYNTSEMPPDEKSINQKFVILSNIILEEIAEAEDADFDPYHAKEEIEQFKKKINRPRKDPKKDKKEKQQQEGRMKKEEAPAEEQPAETEETETAPEETDTPPEESETSATEEETDSSAAAEETTDSGSSDTTE